MKNPKYKKLMDAEPEKLLRAAIQFYASPEHDIPADRLLEIGFALAQPDGWKQVAPIWLEDLESECE